MGSTFYGSEPTKVIFLQTNSDSLQFRQVLSLSESDSDSGGRVSSESVSSTSFTIFLRLKLSIYAYQQILSKYLYDNNNSTNSQLWDNCFDEMVRKQQRTFEPIVYLINFHADTLKFHRIFGCACKYCNHLTYVWIWCA